MKLPMTWLIRSDAPVDAVPASAASFHPRLSRRGRKPEHEDREAVEHHPHRLEDVGRVRQPPEVDRELVDGVVDAIVQLASSARSALPRTAPRLRPSCSASSGR